MPKGIIMVRVMGMVYPNKKLTLPHNGLFALPFVLASWTLRP